MDFKHEINGLKDQGDKNHVDENVSNHGIFILGFYRLLVKIVGVTQE